MFPFVKIAQIIVVYLNTLSSGGYNMTYKSGLPLKNSQDMYAYYIEIKKHIFLRYKGLNFRRAMLGQHCRNKHSTGIICVFLTQFSSF